MAPPSHDPPLKLPISHPPYLSIRLSIPLSLRPCSAPIAQECSDDDRFQAKALDITRYLGSTLSSSLCPTVTSYSCGAHSSLPPSLHPSLLPSLPTHFFPLVLPKSPLSPPQLHPSLTGGSESQVSTRALAMRAPCKDFQTTRPRHGLQTHSWSSLREGTPSGVGQGPGT